MKDNNKNLFITILTIVGIILIIGVSYAFFAYSRTSNKESKLIAGDIYMHFNEEGDSLSLPTIFPQTAEEARAREDNFITFTVSGLNESKKDIYYEIILNYGTKIDDKTRFKDKHLKFDLTEIKVENGQPVKNLVLSAVSFEEISNTRIWVNTIPKYTDEEIEITYELRMWLSDDVLISDTIETADYTTEVYRNSYGNVKVSVSGDFREKTVGDSDTSLVGEPAVTKIKSLVGTNGLVAINTNGTLASEGDTIREYRYSGNAKHCTYAIDGKAYTLNVDSNIDICPSACAMIIGENVAIINGNSSMIVNSGGCTNVGGTEIIANQTTPLDGEVANYIWYNDEMWRVIGVFNEETSNGTTKELVKIIKDEPLLRSSVPDTYTYNNVEMSIKSSNEAFSTSQYAPIYWNYENYFGQLYQNDWTNASLQYYLNDNTVGSNSYYNGIKENYKNMIETVKYSLGNVSIESGISEMYSQERSDDVYDGNQTKWLGKIGLMYPSDYGYASSGVNLNLDGMLSGSFLPNNNMHVNNWIKKYEQMQWLISPTNTPDAGGEYETFAFFGSFGSFLTVSGEHDENEVNVSPVLYLKSDVLITEGDGTEDNPYKLAMETE